MFISIGTFDGFHLGHQQLLEYTIAKAKENRAVATALTFEPPPLKVLRPEAAPPRISTNQQRMDWFGAVGMEAAGVLPFTKELASVVHEPVTLKGEVVSSTRIRKLVADGDVRHAARLLGRAFALTGEVVSGTGIGRKFTFPTLNLKAEQELLPARGVYITRTVLDEEASSHRSVTNVGTRPTFNGAGLSIETHLLDYSGNFSPERIEVRFWKKLRDEKKFSDAEGLKEQIANDIAAANAYFARLRRVRARGMRLPAY